ncbi:hypothetical protein J3R83DRAFT_11942 [Lanmaoa asiatica]|nr:hypothetical protein J3R83DRAFT_11942 [Lanmaoa asiatica]
MCYLPTWPVGFPETGRGRGPGRKPPSAPDTNRPHPKRPSSFDFQTIVTESFTEVGKTIQLEPDEWIRPQPKCVRRFDPYGL